MYNDRTNGEKKHQKELYLLSKKGKYRVHKVKWVGGDSDGKGAIRTQVLDYESKFGGNTKKKKRAKARKRTLRRTTVLNEADFYNNKL